MLRRRRWRRRGRWRRVAVVGGGGAVVGGRWRGRWRRRVVVAVAGGGGRRGGWVVAEAEAEAGGGWWRRRWWRRRWWRRRRRRRSEREDGGDGMIGVHRQRARYRFPSSHRSSRRTRSRLPGTAVSVTPVPVVEVGYASRAAVDAGGLLVTVPALPTRETASVLVVRAGSTGATVHAAAVRGGQQLVSDRIELDVDDHQRRHPNRRVVPGQPAVL